MSESGGDLLFIFPLHGSHVVRSLVVYFAHVINEILQRFLRLKTVVTVFQVDVVGLQFVAVADAGPEVFVFRQLVRREVADAAQTCGEAVEGMEAAGTDAEKGEVFEEGAFVHVGSIR